jgi:hypothetical protein
MAICASTAGIDMTQDEIIEIASQVYGECVWHKSALLRLEAFAKLVAAKAIAELESKEPVAHVYLFDHDGKPRVAWHNAKNIKIGDKLYTRPSQLTEERNFCPRCGKRTADLTVIHTCTPPQNIEQDLSEQGRKKSAILGNNIEEMVNNGLPFLTALDTALKVYDHHTPRLHQPQRTWVGLTAEEVRQMCGSVPSMKQAVQEAEAKLKEKNT